VINGVSVVIDCGGKINKGRHELKIMVTIYSPLASLCVILKSSLKIYKITQTIWTLFV